MAHLLILEDDDDLNGFLCDVLNERGHTCDCVRTRVEADAALRAKRYDLVVADAILPDGSGHDIAAMCANAGVTALLMTGYAHEVDTLIARGATCLVKPFRVAEFISLVESHLPRP